jgi:hypothetical protein
MWRLSSRLPRAEGNPRLSVRARGSEDLHNMQKGYSSETHFLNVDLDIYSKHDLSPLVKCFGKKVVVLHAGVEHRNYSAHLEIAKLTRTADSIIRAFCKLVDALPERERALWNNATVRSFSIGIQAGGSRIPAISGFSRRPSKPSAIYRPKLF